MNTKRWLPLVLSLVLFLSYCMLTAAGTLPALLCNGDANRDGVVNLSDLVAVAIRYGARVAPGTPEDKNGDGKVDLFDLICVTVHYQLIAPVPPNPGAPVVKVAAWCSQFDAPGDDRYNLNGEYVCFVHMGGGPVNMTGWHVKDEQGHTYTFPMFTLPVGAYVRLHTGSGTNTATDLYWAQDSAVWDNDKDTVFLYDDQWRPVDAYTYAIRLTPVP